MPAGRTFAVPLTTDVTGTYRLDSKQWRIDFANNRCSIGECHLHGLIRDVVFIDYERESCK